MIDIQYIAAGAMTGLVVGLTGVGGGALMTPILLLFLEYLQPLQLQLIYGLQHSLKLQEPLYITVPAK